MDAMNKFKWSRSEGLSYNQLVLKLPVNVRCSKTDNAEWSVSPRVEMRQQCYETNLIYCVSLHMNKYLVICLQGIYTAISHLHTITNDENVFAVLSSSLSFRGI